MNLALIKKPAAKIRTENLSHLQERRRPLHSRALGAVQPLPNATRAAVQPVPNSALEERGDGAHIRASWTPR